MSLDVLSCVARPVFLLLIYADCDRNTASFPVSRQNASKILRDNLFNIALAAHWHGNNQSSDHDCKNFRSISSRDFLPLRPSLQCCHSRAPSNTSVKRCVHERAAAGEESANPQWVGSTLHGCATQTRA